MPDMVRDLTASRAGLYRLLRPVKLRYAAESGSARRNSPRLLVGRQIIAPSAAQRRRWNSAARAAPRVRGDGALSTAYGVKRVSCVDNILDLRLAPILFPALQRSGLDLELFYEVKANLRQDQLAMMRAGGVKSVQPGIESFSNQVLRLMEKGCTGLQNIQLLRWCEEAGIMAAWNLLSGFPGEDPDEYRTAELLPLLTHCSPHLVLADPSRSVQPVLHPDRSLRAPAPSSGAGLLLCVSVRAERAHAARILLRLPLSGRAPAVRLHQGGEAGHRRLVYGAQSVPQA